MSNVYLINHHYCKLVHDKTKGCSDCILMRGNMCIVSTTELEDKTSRFISSNMQDCITAAMDEDKDDGYINYHFEKCKLSKGDKLITKKQ